VFSVFCAFCALRSAAAQFGAVFCSFIFEKRGEKRKRLLQLGIYYYM